MIVGTSETQRTTIDSSLGGGILGSGPPAISRRTLTPQELFQEDIAAATAAARTVHAAADQMSMLRNENQRLRKELSSFNVSKHLHVLLFFLLLFTESVPFFFLLPSKVQFFEEIEDLKFAYLVQVRRSDALTRQIYEKVANPDEVMQLVEEEAGREVDLQRNGSHGRRKRWRDLQQRQRGGINGVVPPLALENNRGPIALANEWEVSDQWLQLVFDCADGSALAELERQCRMYDMTNTGTIAAPELRMALRATLYAPGLSVPTNSNTMMNDSTVVLSPSAMVFGELVINIRCI